MIAATDRIFDLPDRLRELAQSDPDRVALVHVHGNGQADTTTYREFSERAERIAVGLREIGVGEGTLCSFMVPPGEDAMVLALALWRVGAVMVGIEPHSHGMRKVAKCLGRVGPTVFFGTPEAQLARRIFGWGRGTIKTSVTVGGRGKLTLKSLERDLPADPKGPDVSPDDAAVIAFTTGSTGLPKPTVMTHRNFSAMIENVGTQWGLQERGNVVDMPTFPMFWIIGMSHGGTVVVPPMNFATRGPGDADPAKLAETINEHRVGSMFASPALLANLSAYCNSRGITLPSVRRIVAGGAEVNGPIYAAVKQMIPGGELYSNYGATEALPVAEIDGTTVLTETWPQTQQGRGLCVGDPLPGTEVRIVAINDGPIDSIDNAVALPVDQIGEVIVRGDRISSHYHDAPQEMAKNKVADPDGRWHRLGDCGFLDDRGRLWVCGRVSHRVTAADRTYFALCTEPVFNAHADVARTALIRATAPDGATEPAICVELEASAAGSWERVERELRQRATEHDSTRGITRFVHVQKLPVDRRHNAKLDRPALSAKYG